MKKIDCFTCKHFYITWDRNFPYGCKPLGFKSKRLPSTEVKKASGDECMGYEGKSAAGN